MTEETTKVFSKICGKVNSDFAFMTYFDIDPRYKNFWIRGFLLSPETLKAVFGDKDTCFICGGQEVDAGKSFNGEVTEYNPTCKGCGANWMDKAEFPEEGNYIPAWEWHGKEMVCLDLDALLQYYEHYL